MNLNRYKFVEQKISGDLSDKKVLEVGSRIVKGSLRGYIESLNPREYTGIDIVPGVGVDLILDIHQLANHFGENVFDLIICSDTLEHIEEDQLVCWMGANCGAQPIPDHCNKPMEIVKINDRK